MEDLEQIMRRIHVLFAKCEPYGDEKENTIIVPKKEVFRLLEQLNYAVIALLDRYEGTEESRERGLSEYRRCGEKMMEQAQAGAEDVYAASLIYTDNMLEELEDVVAEAKESLWGEYARVADWLDGQTRLLTENQEEIKRQLRAMAQGEKYLRLIYRENARLRRLAQEEFEDESEDDEELEEDYGDESRKEDEPEDSGEEELEEDSSDASWDEGAPEDGESEGNCSDRPRNGDEPENDSGENSRFSVRNSDAFSGPEKSLEPGKYNVSGSKKSSKHSRTAASAKRRSPEDEGRNASVPQKESGRGGNVREKQGGIPEHSAADAGGNGKKAKVSGGPGNSGSKSGAGGNAEKKKQPGGAKSGKKRRPAVKHPRMSPDLETEWAEEENRPVRKIGTALYEDVGQSYDPPVKKVSYEVRVNQAYFDQLGESAADLDAEYYQWKEEQEKQAGEAGAEAAAREEDEEDAGRRPENRKKDKKLRRFGFGRKK